MIFQGWNSSELVPIDAEKRKLKLRKSPDYVSSEDKRRVYNLLTAINSVGNGSAHQNENCIPTDGQQPETKVNSLGLNNPNLLIRRNVTK